MKRRDFLKTSVVAGAALSLNLKDYRLLSLRIQ